MGVAKLRVDGRSRRFLAIQTLQICLVRFMAFGLILLGFGEFGWIYGQLFGLAVTACAMWFFAYGDFDGSFDRALAPKLYRFCWSLMPMALSNWVMRGSDQYMINWCASSKDEGLKQNGLYGVGSRISSIMDFVGMAFNLGWQRFAFKNIRHDDGPRLMARGVTLFLLVAGYGALGLCLLGDDLVYWMLRKDYFAGTRIIPILTLASFLWATSNVVETALYTSNRVSLLGVINIAAAVTNILLNFILIPRYGYQGAAIATALTMAIKLLIVWRESYRTLKIPYEFRRLAMVAAVFLCAYGLGQIVRQPNVAALFGTSERVGWLISTVIQGLIAFAAPFTFLVIPFFSADERLKIRSIERKIESMLGRRPRETVGSN
jgi:O-antigen/teichoic acid export membrane protein